MIRVSVNGYKLVATGHAGYAEHGHDIVCSAVSMLLELLAEQIQEAEAKGNVKDMTVDLQPGMVHLECTPCWWFGKEMGYLYESITKGFRMLAEEYPDYVVIKSAEPMV